MPNGRITVYGGRVGGRVTMVVALLALAGTAHVSVLYLVLVGALPPQTPPVLAPVLLSAGLYALLRQSWQGGKSAAGWVLGAAATVLALAFVTTVSGGTVAAGGDTVRVAVETVSLGPLPVVFVGFERGGFKVSQFGQVVAVGYLLLGAGLWVHPRVGGRVTQR